MHIQYSIETNEDYYTREEADHEYIPELLIAIESNVQNFVNRNYPDAEIDFRYVPETMSYDNKSRVDGYTEHEIIEEIEEFVGGK